MTVEEIFAKITNHQLKGTMIHEQMANYYDFLGLAGYKRCHEYHFWSELSAYRQIYRYYLNHYSKLLPTAVTDTTDVIPDTWHKYAREDVDGSTKKNAVEKGLNLWINWEKETKKLYEDVYKELMELGEVAAALEIKELICDVDCELKYAERYKLNKQAVNYNIEYIVNEQDCFHKKFKDKIKKIKLF